MRQIKAQDMKPGMEIEWKRGGYYTRCVVGLVHREDLSYPAYSIRAVGSSAGWKIFSEGEEVTVLKEAQPPEPTAFGACVEVAGVKYVRCDDDALMWKAPDNAGWWGWDSLCDKGHVTVINPDPFATVQAEPEACVWERWEDVPKLTPVRLAEPNGEAVYRKAGGEIQRQILDGSWWPSILTTDDIRSHGFFTEVRDA